MADLLQHIAKSEFPHMDRLIHVFVGGSELHGAKVRGTDDLDIYGVYIEPPDLALGLESLPHYVWSTAGNERRNGPADVDVTLYSLLKWAGLACKGNPTALHFLFTKGTIHSPMWALMARQPGLYSFSSVRQPLYGPCERPTRAHNREKGSWKEKTASGTRGEIRLRRENCDAHPASSLPM